MDTDKRRELLGKIAGAAMRLENGIASDTISLDEMVKEACLINGALTDIYEDKIGAGLEQLKGVTGG